MTNEVLDAPHFTGVPFAPQSYSAPFASKKLICTTALRKATESPSIPCNCQLVTVPCLGAERLLKSSQLRVDITFDAPPLDDVFAIAT
jgi:hypothetical protein